MLNQSLAAREATDAVAPRRCKCSLFPTAMLTACALLRIPSATGAGAVHRIPCPEDAADGARRGEASPSAVQADPPAVCIA